MNEQPFDRRRFLKTGSVAVAGSTLLPATTVAQETASEIADWNDLDNIRDNLGEDYVLVTDLDAESDGYDDLVGDPDDGWTPIGNRSNPFTGTLDGDGYEIADLTINQPNQNYVGLFGETDEARIVDLSATDADITGDQFTGTFIGDAELTTMVDLATTGEVQGSKMVGGLAGRSNNLHEIRDSQSSTAVSGDNRVGGLVGEFAEGDMMNAAATGPVSGDDFVGGLIGRGFFAAFIENSHATGAVSDGSSMGGLVGQASDMTIRESYATGDVTGETSLGGLVGSNVFASVERSYATGTVDGDGRVGGLVGAVSEGGEVVDCYASGAVSGETAGGVVGITYVYDGIHTSYAVGSVSGTETAGGLVGREDTSEIHDSYWDVPATGQTNGDGGGTIGTVDEDSDGGGMGFGTLDEEPPAEEMTGDEAEENMEGFDFDEMWETVVDPDDYPRLQWQAATESPLEPYTNENNVVDTSGLLDAINDWRSAQIDTALLLDVIDAWRTGTRIP
ncbi:GLUG motif-containing protein [Halobacteriaceae archaeon SHR40]|uniref:GLUG motif-containing protein n=1 Tax=Halovenus amylolytica TaxID=2500550 RepID=UPI000FE3A183